MKRKFNDVTVGLTFLFLTWLLVFVHGLDSDPVQVGHMAVFAAPVQAAESMSAPRRPAPKTPFEAKVEDVSQMLKIHPEWLLSAMDKESGINPQAVNPHSGATGLIQFMPATAAELGTSLPELKRMGAEQQLEYVYLYLLKVRQRYGLYRDLTDLYLGILYPKARGQKLHYAMFIRGTKRYAQNKGLDYNNDGAVTVGDIDDKLRAEYPEAYKYEAPMY